MEERVFGGRYRIVRHLARGGMAEVYVAEDQLLNRRVAVKVLFAELAEDDDFVERFRREARAAASLNHHNIVSVYDFGEDEGSWFIVMEYVEGRTLRDLIRAVGPMDPARAAELASEVAAALVAAHAQGIVHRDVKPANVLISSSAGTVKVADFGIARAANARQGLTMPGTVLGTATYLSPEQAKGADVDFRSDIYSLGMVLYEMLAGRPPFTGDSAVAVAYQQLSQIAPPPSTHNPRVPPALDAIVLRAMAKDPADRQATAQVLRAELLDFDRAAGDPDATAAMVTSSRVEAGPSTSVMSSVPPVGRSPRGGAGPADGQGRRAAVIVAAGLVALVVIAILVLAKGGGDDQPGVTVPSTTAPSTTSTTVRSATSIPVTQATTASTAPVSTSVAPAATVVPTTVPPTTVSPPTSSVIVPTTSAITTTSR